MNYIKITKTDIANGLGIGVVLWVAGCDHHCEGCHNPQTWNKDAGTLFTNDTLNEILDELNKSYYSRLTISGGDPLMDYNIGTIADVITKVKTRYGGRINVWIYTGYTYEELLNKSSHRNSIDCILSKIDTLVDGKFDILLRDVSLAWKGSSNQRVINVKKSIESNSIVIQG